MQVKLFSIFSKCSACKEKLEKRVYKEDKGSQNRGKGHAYDQTTQAEKLSLN